jgi:NAD(P)-dependent dehydrogenase (short-subunit alcohol dehydrogenase family)
MKDAKKIHSLIIGGTKGTGRAVVRALAKEGHVVSVIGRSTPSPSEASLSNVSFWALDLAQHDKIAGILDDIIKKSGKINNLVFLQRYRGEGDSWKGEIDVSLTATKIIIDYLADKVANKFAEKENNSIVIISSIASRFIVEEQPLSYHLGKAALSQMVNYYAVRLGRQGIRVNGVSPGTILKQESRDFYLNNKKLYSLYQEIMPLGRMITSEDVADVVGFLCSSKAAAVTGQIITLDGGVSLRGQESLARKLTHYDNPKTTITAKTKK